MRIKVSHVLQNASATYLSLAETLAIINAKLLGVLIKVLPADGAHTLVRNRVLCSTPTRRSILALNAVLLEAPETLSESQELPGVICEAIKNPVSV